jgi:hypothetical protein
MCPTLATFARRSDQGDIGRGRNVGVLRDVAMTLKQGVFIALVFIAFAVLTRIVADVFDISRTEAGWIELVIVSILGFAWRRRRSRLEKRTQGGDEDDGTLQR